MKKLNSEKVLSFFIILLPILDITSFIFRKYFNTSFSPSTFIRPIIPVIIFIYLFFKNNFKLKSIIIFSIYIIYSIIHLFIFYKLKTDISYGTIIHEAQYLINYSFAILNLFVFIYIFYKKNTEKIYKSILISNGIYLLSIYISIITKTSSSTYIEGIGYKGWFESGNSLSNILILNLFIIFSSINKFKNNKLKYISITEIVLSGIFLIFLLGTRTGLFGFILVSVLYIVANIVNYLKNKLFIEKNKINNKNKIIIFLCLILSIVLIAFVFVKGSSFLKRRKYLQSIENNVIDASTGSSSHIIGNVLKLKEQIENSSVDEKYIPLPVQKSILELYAFANKSNINNTNRRIQQLVYNAFLVKNQSNILYILFGNGFLTNYAELVLEMEIPALLFNFGFLGFILYFIPFLILFIYYINYGIKNIKKIDVEFIMLFLGIIMAFALSFLSGQILFNSSAMIILTLLNTVLLNKCTVQNKTSGNEVKKEKKQRKEFAKIN